MTAGDVSRALEGVLLRFRSMVLSVGAKHALREGDVDELLQDVRIRLWHGRNSSEEIEALPTSYVYQTAMSAAIDLLRKRRRVSQRVEELPDELGERTPHRGTADASLRLGELEEQVERALGRLVPSRRMVVRMSLAGYERHEIVERLGWGDGKVRNLLSRGMEDLRQQLKSQLEEDPQRG